jgi:hypothetical protein
MTHQSKTILFAAFALTLSEAAFAYVGPGAGLSLLGALWGLLAALAAAVLFVILWPLRQMLKRRRLRQVAAAPGTEASRSDDARPAQAPGANAADARHAG